MNLRHINLNLLKTLQILFETRNVTDAAKILFLTQPAISTALKQLRALFKDPLFIKGTDRYFKLTHRALQIQPELERILKETEHLIGIHNEMIVPETLNEQFHIALHNRVGSVIFPRLYRALKEIAPHVTIKHTDITDLRTIPTQELQQFDFIIGTFDQLPKNFLREAYFDDQLVCLSGVNSLNKKEQITKEDLNTHEHVVLSPMSYYTKIFTDTLLTSYGIKRTYRMEVSNLLLAVQLASSESLLLIMMKKRAEFLQKIFPLKIFSLPFESPTLKTDILYKKADEDNPVKQWFKSLLHKIIEDAKEVHLN